MDYPWCLAKNLIWDFLFLCNHMKCQSSDNQVLVHCSSTEHILIHCLRDKQVLVDWSKFCYMICPLYSSSPIPADICIWCSCVLSKNYICKECITLIVFSILQHWCIDVCCIHWLGVDLQADHWYLIMKVQLFTPARRTMN